MGRTTCNGIAIDMGSRTVREVIPTPASRAKPTDVPSEWNDARNASVGGADTETAGAFLRE